MHFWSSILISQKLDFCNKWSINIYNILIPIEVSLAIFLCEFKTFAWGIFFILLKKSDNSCHHFLFRFIDAPVVQMYLFYSNLTNEDWICGTYDLFWLTIIVIDFLFKFSGVNKPQTAKLLELLWHARHVTTILETWWNKILLIFTFLLFRFKSGNGIGFVFRFLT